jgi:hypothetical protein
MLRLVPTSSRSRHPSRLRARRQDAQQRDLGFPVTTRLSEHDHPAVDHQHLAGHQVAVLRGDEDRRAGEVLGLEGFLQGRCGDGSSSHSEHSMQSKPDVIAEVQRILHRHLEFKRVHAKRSGAPR